MSTTSNSNRSNVLDTFRIDKNGILLKSLHVTRTMQALQLMSPISGGYINLITDAYHIIEQKHQDNFAQRIRIVFNIDDYSYEYTAQPLEAIEEPVQLQIIENISQSSGRGAQNFKWESRPYWEKIMALKSKSADDVISFNELGNCVETSRFNLFFFDAKVDLVFTPSLSSGCIAGVFREWVLGRHNVELPKVGIKSLREMEIHFSEIGRYQLFVANSVRGVLPAGLAT